MTNEDIYDYLANASMEDIIMIIGRCTMMLGWQMAIEEGQENVRGMTVGTPEYIDTYFKGDK